MVNPLISFLCYGTSLIKWRAVTALGIVVGLLIYLMGLVFSYRVMFLVIGALVGKALGEKFDLGLDPNMLSAIFGVFFLIGSFVILRVGSSALSQETYMPRIVAILRDEE